MAKFNFGPNANSSAVSSHSIQVLTEILIGAGVSTCSITSTTRTPADQARAMYANLQSKGVASERNLYKAAGNKIIDVYVAQKNAGKTPTQIKSAMEGEIVKVGPGKVSRHCADPTVLNVIDIAPSSVSNKSAFVNAVNSAVTTGKVSKFLMPPSDKAYHLEIPQT